MELALRVTAFLGVLGIGVVARRAGLAGQSRRDRLNALAFYIALPALIFTSTYEAPLAEILSGSLVLGIAVVILLTLGLAIVVHSRIKSADRRGVAIVQSYHSNLGYLGVPIIATTLGTTAAGTASVVLGVGALTQVPLTIFVLTTITGEEARAGKELRALGTNPVLWALAFGLAISQFDLTVPGQVVFVLEHIGSTALPLSLLLVGASLEPRLPETGHGTLLGTVALKVFAMPALALGAFTVLQATSLTRRVAIVMFATPTAVSTFVYAVELGGDDRFASLGVFVTTVVSLVWLGVLLQVV